MRDVDPEEIEASLQERDRRRMLEARRQKLIETWRMRLLREGEAALDALLATFPRADRNGLSQLIATALDDRAAESLRIAAGRELYRALREQVAAAP